MKRKHELLETMKTARIEAHTRLLLKHTRKVKKTKFKAISEFF